MSMTNHDVASYTLELLKKAGADAAQCAVSRGGADELNADSGEFSLMRTLFNSSLTIKAIKDGKKGVASTNRIDLDSIGEAVASCISSAENSIPDEAEIIAPDMGKASFEGGVTTADKGRLFDRLEEFMKTVGRDYPKVVLEQMISSHSHTDRLYMNSNGTEFTYKYGAYSFEAMFSAKDGEKSSSFNGYGISTTHLNNPFLEMGMLKTLIGESERQIDTRSVDGKFVGTLLITPACTMELMSAILGNCVSDVGIIDGTSPWKDKLGKSVASSGITLSAMPLDERMVFGERYTADGYPSENYDIIKDGVLKSFMLSQYGALKSGNERARNTSRNIVMAAGESSLEEMIAGIDRGILLNRFSGGSPGINGDFSGVAKNSFLIEKGKIAGAVSETMISGNLLDMLNSLIAVSKDRVCDGGTILPWASFGGITISGK